MVSIVIVSHSQRLAAGVKELAEQMGQGQVPVAIAAGIEDEEQPIGTNAMDIAEAVRAVYDDDGVLVLMDLGSAILNAEMALEFLEPEQQANVRLCPAPLVEGAVAAVVQASTGATLDQVYREAMGALAVKEREMPGREGPEGEEATAPVGEEAEEEGDAVSTHLPIRNKLGLHARPAARFVQTANRFTADVRVRKDDEGTDAVNAKSINQVATLGARQGDTIVVSARGPDAEEALAALEALATDNFGDREEEGPAEEAAAAPTAPRPGGEEGVLQGIAASDGVAIGPVAQYRPRLPDVQRRPVEDVEAEWLRLQAAIEAARAEIEALQEQATEEIGEEEAGIFEAHALFLQDPALVDAARERLQAERINAEAVWQAEVEAMADRYREIEDAYMQARAADVVDVGQRVLGHLMAVERPSLAMEDPSILVAADLTPSDTIGMDPERVLGICTELGGATSHSAILARAYGIPAIVGLGPALQTLEAGRTVAMDGETGRLWTRPDEALLADLREEREAWLAEQAQAKEKGRQPAVTRDGFHIEVAANIGGPNDAAIALDYGAEGVGLFRTEFLFLERDSAPSETEQTEAYVAAAAAIGERPLIIRTLDVGGDKPLPYLEGRDPEENPFLGWRGIRFCLDRPEIFRPQLRAILRAAAAEDGTGRNVKVMFPMVSAVEEVRRAKALLAEAGEALRAEGVSVDENVEVGIMIEVPSAVAIADQLAAEVDFFSIGTNDLTQYVMAADRGNARVASLASALQPAVLRLIGQTVEAAHEAGIWVGLCGELAGDERATPLLLGLGLDELSMSAPSIPAVKEAIRSLTMEEAQRMAGKALQLSSASDVEEWLEQERVTDRRSTR